MKKLGLTTCFLMVGLALGTAHICAADPLVTMRMLKDDPDGVQGDRICKGEADMDGGTKLPFLVEVTSKGNGTLEIGNLHLHIVDEHDDGRVYKNDMLNVEMTDLGKKGDMYMVVSGTAIFTGEKETDPGTPEAVVFIYRFDVNAKKFERVYKHATFDIEF